MARLLSVVVLTLLLAGAFAQRSPSPSPKVAASPSPSPSPDVEEETPKVSPSPAVAAPKAATAPVTPTPSPSPSPAASPSPSPAAAAQPAAEPSNLDPQALAAIDDAIARAKPGLRGRDAQKVLDNMKGPLTKVAEAKASGVPVQIAVARSVTDVQKQVPLNAQSRQAVLDAAYRVYTASPATLASPSPSPAPEANVTEPSPSPDMDVMNTTMDGNMTMDSNMTMDANATMPDEAITDMDTANATTPMTKEPAGANATDSRAGAAAAPSPSPKPTRSAASSLGLVGSSLVALMTAAVVVLL